MGFAFYDPGSKRPCRRHPSALQEALETLEALEPQEALQEAPLSPAGGTPQLLSEGRVGFSTLLFVWKNYYKHN